MLRITPHAEDTEYSIELEGSLSGPWVRELAACWIDAALAKRGRPVCIDLADVCHVDDAGRELMTLMYRCGVRFEARGFVMPEVVREISRTAGDGRRS